MKYVYFFIIAIAVAVLVSYYPQALAQTSRVFTSAQVGLNPVNGYCLTTDGSISTWTTCGGGGSSKWTDNGTVITPTNNESIYVTGSSTLIELVTNTIRASSSAGIIFRANSGTLISDFGAGGGSNATFYGGVNIDGTTRLATSLSGILKATSGTISNAIAGTDYVATTTGDWLGTFDGQEGSFYLNASNLNAGTVPSARISGSYTGITGLGTITNGVWQGTAIDPTYLDSTVLLSSEIDSSLKLANLLGDETGSGSVVFGTSPTISGPTITGLLAGAAASFSGNVSVSGTTTLATTTMSSSTIARAFVTSLFNVTGTSTLATTTMASTTITQAFVTGTLGVIGTSTFATTTLASTTIRGNLLLPTQTVSRMLATDANGLATTTAASAALLNSLSDETGTGVAVFGTTPTFTTRITTPEVTGGTAVSSVLTLRSTTAVGTTDRISFLVGNNGAREAMRIHNNGFISVGSTTAPTTSVMSVVGTSTSPIFTIFTTAQTKIMEVLSTGSTTWLGTHDYSNAVVKQKTYKSVTWPGTATTTSGTTTIAIGPAMTAEAFNTARCRTTSGTATWTFKDDSNNVMNSGLASTTSTSTLVTFSTNNTFTVGEGRNFDVGALTAAQITCTVEITVNN